MSFPLYKICCTGSRKRGTSLIIHIKQVFIYDRWFASSTVQSHFLRKQGKKEERRKISSRMKPTHGKVMVNSSFLYFFKTTLRFPWTPKIQTRPPSFNLSLLVQEKKTPVSRTIPKQKKYVFHSTQQPLSNPRNPIQIKLCKDHVHTLMAYFRWGKWISFFLCFSVFLLASSLVMRRRIARVYRGRRSRGRYFLFL